MGYRGILERIRRAVERTDYLTPTSHIADPRQQEALADLAALMRTPGFDASDGISLVREAHRDGRLDRVKMLSALGVIAASPQVRDYAEAFRLASQQELAALDLGGDGLDANLASAYRHRGVVSYLMGHYEVALESFTAALERERTAENLGNVLCALVHEDPESAAELLRDVRDGFPTEIRTALEERVREDGDLKALRNVLAE